MLLGQCSQRSLPVLSLGVLSGIVVFGQSIINIRLYSTNRFFQTARFNIFTRFFMSRSTSQWRHVSARILLCITVRCFNNNAFYCNWICPSWVYWSHGSAHKTLCHLRLQWTKINFNISPEKYFFAYLGVSCSFENRSDWFITLYVSDSDRFAWIIEMIQFYRRFIHGSGIAAFSGLRKSLKHLHYTK